MPTRKASTPASIRFFAWAAVTTAHPTGGKAEGPVKYPASRTPPGPGAPMLERLGTATDTRGGREGGKGSRRPPTPGTVGGSSCQASCLCATKTRPWPPPLLPPTLDYCAACGRPSPLPRNTKPEAGGAPKRVEGGQEGGGGAPLQLRKDQPEAGTSRHRLRLSRETVTHVALVVLPPPPGRRPLCRRAGPPRDPTALHNPPMLTIPTNDLQLRILVLDVVDHVDLVDRVSLRGVLGGGAEEIHP